jgi:hypothetical protein
VKWIYTQNQKMHNKGIFMAIGLLRLLVACGLLLSQQGLSAVNANLVEKKVVVFKHKAEEAQKVLSNALDEILVGKMSFDALFLQEQMNNIAHANYALGNMQAVLFGDITADNAKKQKEIAQHIIVIAKEARKYLKKAYQLAQFETSLTHQQLTKLKKRYYALMTMLSAEIRTQRMITGDIMSVQKKLVLSAGAVVVTAVGLFSAYKYGLFNDFLLQSSSVEEQKENQKEITPKTIEPKLPVTEQVTQLKQEKNVVKKEVNNDQPKDKQSEVMPEVMVEKVEQNDLTLEECLNKEIQKLNSMHGCWGSVSRRLWPDAYSGIDAQEEIVRQLQSQLLVSQQLPVTQQNIETKPIEVVQQNELLTPQQQTVCNSSEITENKEKQAQDKAGLFDTLHTLVFGSQQNKEQIIESKTQDNSDEVEQNKMRMKQLENDISALQQQLTQENKVQNQMVGWDITRNNDWDVQEQNAKIEELNSKLKALEEQQKEIKQQLPVIEQVVQQSPDVVALQQEIKNEEKKDVAQMVAKRVELATQQEIKAKAMVEKTEQNYLALKQLLDEAIRELNRMKGLATVVWRWWGDPYPDLDAQEKLVETLENQLRMQQQSQEK